MDIDQKKVYPIFNPSNILIDLGSLKKILKKGDYSEEINDIGKWRLAFVHKSYCKYRKKKFKNETYEYKEDMTNVIELQDKSNERLEWLGDGILQSVIAMYLWERFPKQEEGFLTKIRSKMVRTESLANMSRFLGVYKFILISQHVEQVCNGRNNPRILEDCFEALIGAMYSDLKHKGIGYAYKCCSNFIISAMEKALDLTDMIMNDDNYKDQLMRYYQKKFDGNFPKYKQLSVEIPENGRGKIFHMGVTDVANNIVGKGAAKSKKEAEQIAAKKALIHFEVIEI